MPSPRRINDAQVDRLLASLQSLEYRQKLAHKIAAKEGVKYDSAMRRLQRYVTKGAEKRLFARAPVIVRRETIKQARGLPVPVDLPKPAPKPTPKPKQLELPRPTFYREIEPSPLKSRYREPEGRDLPDNYEYRAILAYFDGDADEAAEALREFGAPLQTSRILELTAKSVDVLGVKGIGRLADAVRDWYETIDEADVQDVDDFSDLLRGSLPEWMTEILLEDLANTDSTFAEWMDAWRDDGMVFHFHGDSDADELSDSEFWKLWRAAYARAKR